MFKYSRMINNKNSDHKTLKSISLNMTQTEFQTEMGRLEVLGELLIQNKNKND